MGGGGGEEEECPRPGQTNAKRNSLKGDPKHDDVDSSGIKNFFFFFKYTYGKKAVFHSVSRPVCQDNMASCAAILCPSVSICDVMNTAKLYQIHHEPTFFCSWLVKREPTLHGSAPKTTRHIKATLKS